MFYMQQAPFMPLSAYSPTSLFPDSLPLYIPSSVCIVRQLPLAISGTPRFVSLSITKSRLAPLWNDAGSFLIAHHLAWWSLFLVIVSAIVCLSGLCLCMLCLLPPLFLIPFDKVLDQIREQILSPSTFPYRNRHGKNLIMTLRAAVDLISLLL